MNFIIEVVVTDRFHCIWFIYDENRGGTLTFYIGYKGFNTINSWILFSIIKMYEKIICMTSILSWVRYSPLAIALLCIFVKYSANAAGHTGVIRHQYCRPHKSFLVLILISFSNLFPFTGVKKRVLFTQIRRYLSYSVPHFGTSRIGDVSLYYRIKYSLSQKYYGYHW